MDTEKLHNRRELTRGDLERINLGREFWKANVDGIQDEEVSRIVSRFCKNIIEMIYDGLGIAFSGSAGVGKTSCASIILKEAIRRRFSGYFVTFEDLQEIRFEDRKYGDGSDGVSVKQQLTRCDLLVLDNFNEPFLRDKAFGPDQLEKLIRKRNDNKKSTILTTRIGSLGDYYSLRDMILFSMAPVRVDGVNLREEVKKEVGRKVIGNGS